MRLSRCAEPDGQPFWALIEGEGEGAAATPIVGRLADWAPLLTGGDTAAIRRAGPPRPLSSLRLLAPVERGGKMVVVGANFDSHLRELDVPRATAPFAFLKAYGALIGPYDDIVYPAKTRALDHEIEMVAVIGAAVDPAIPMKSVLGYTVGNEVSGRDLQPGLPGIGMDLFAAKSLQGTNPVGPWIVTRDVFGDDPPDLRMTMTVNGIRRQDGRTSDMTYSVAELIVHVNAISTLEPGDVLYTGTPEGVGWKAGRFLADGDLVEGEIEGLGVVRNRVRGPL